MAAEVVPDRVSLCALAEALASEVEIVCAGVHSACRAGEPGERAVRGFGKLISSRTAALAQHGYTSVSAFRAALPAGTARDHLAVSEHAWEDVLRDLDAHNTAGLAHVAPLHPGHPLPAFHMPCTRAGAGADDEPVFESTLTLDGTQARVMRGPPAQPLRHIHVHARVCSMVQT